MKTTINGGVMIDPPSVIIQTDIQKFADVPQEIRITIEEANKCFAFDAPIGGACLVRKTLDLFLYALGFSAKYTGEKIADLERACRKGGFKHLGPRVTQFYSIAGLAGGAMHAPTSNKPLFSSEWMGHLNSVEGAVKQTWSRRTP